MEEEFKKAALKLSQESYQPPSSLRNQEKIRLASEINETGEIFEDFVKCTYIHAQKEIMYDAVNFKSTTQCFQDNNRY